MLFHRQLFSFFALVVLSLMGSACNSTQPGYFPETPSGEPVEKINSESESLSTENSDSAVPLEKEASTPQKNLLAEKVSFFKFGEKSKAYHLSEFKGQNMILMFWASWCLPCLDKIRTLRTVLPQLEKNGYTLLSINIEDDYKETLPALIERMEINFPIYLDQSTELRTALNMRPNAVNIITPWDACYNIGPDLAPYLHKIEHQEEGALEELLGVLNQFYDAAKTSGC